MDQFKLQLKANSVRFLKKKNVGKKTFRIEVEDGVLSALKSRYKITNKFVMCDKLILDFGLLTQNFIALDNIFELKCIEIKLNEGRHLSYTTKSVDGCLELHRFRSSDFVSARFTQKQVNTFALNESDEEFCRNYFL